ncbi:MAG: PAS domain-containing protein, partial [Desulfovermiculus sp.]
DSIRMNKDTYEIEHRIIRDRNGGIRTVFEKCYYIRDDSGNIVRSIGMVQDITDQKQKEREIKEREEELQIIFNTVEFGGPAALAARRAKPSLPAQTSRSLAPGGRCRRCMARLPRSRGGQKTEISLYAMSTAKNS